MRNDRRTKYTLDVIKKAVIDALLCQPINKITVRDICDAADINRGTFYLHYQDIYALMEALELEFADELIEILQQPHSVFTGDFSSFLLDFMKHLEENPHIELILQHPAATGKGIQKIVDYTYQQYVSRWPLYGKVSESEMVCMLNYTWYGTLYALRKQQEAGTCSKEEFVTIIARIVEHGFSAFLSI